MYNITLSSKGQVKVYIYFTISAKSYKQVWQVLLGFPIRNFSVLVRFLGWFCLTSELYISQVQLVLQAVCVSHKTCVLPARVVRRRASPWGARTAAGVRLATDGMPHMLCVFR